MVGEEWEGRTGRERTGKCIQIHHYQIHHLSSKWTNKRLAAGLRPDQLGELKGPPEPLAAVEATEENTL